MKSNNYSRLEPPALQFYRSSDVLLSWYWASRGFTRDSFLWLQFPSCDLWGCNYTCSLRIHGVLKKPTLTRYSIVYCNQLGSREAYCSLSKAENHNVGHPAAFFALIGTSPRFMFRHPIITMPTSGRQKDPVWHSMRFGTRSQHEPLFVSPSV